MVSQVGSVFEAIKKPLEDKPSNPFEAIKKPLEDNPFEAIKKPLEDKPSNPFEAIKKPLQDEPTEVQKAKYGFDKEPWIGGSVWRLIQATTGMGVEGDTFAERRENAWNRHMEEVYEKHPWAKDGKYDMDAAVIGGEVSSIMADPLLWIPWIGWGGKVYKTGQVGSKAYQAATTAGKVGARAKQAAAVGAFSGTIGGADMAIRLLDKDGRIDPATWTTATGIATVFGAGLPVAGAVSKKGLEKVLPRYFSNESAAREALKESIESISKRNAKAGIDAEGLKEIATNPVLAGARNLYQTHHQRLNVVKELDNFRVDVGELQKVNQKLESQKIKDLFVGKRAKQIRKNRAKYLSEKTKFEEILQSNKRFEELTDIKLQSDKDIVDKLAAKTRQAWDDATYSGGELLANIQEEIYKKGGAAALTDRVLKSVAASVTYPAFFGLTGGVMGAISSDDDATVTKWAYGGAAIGLAYRFGLQRKILPKKVSDDVFGYQFRNWLNFGLRRTKIFLGMTLGTKLEARGPVLEKFSRDMFRSFKGSDINSVEAAFENQTIRYRNEVSNKVFNMGGMNDPDVQEIAKAISNGAKLKDNIYFKDGRVVKLSQIKSENRDTFRLALNISKGADDVFRQIYDDAKNVGFVLPTRLKKYFRRVYDLNYISQNEDQFIDDVAKAISAQAKRDGKTISNPKKSARNIFTAITKNEFGEIVTPSRGTGRIAAGKLRLPLSESLAYERKLVGDYDLIDGPLSKYFVNDISAVINDTVQKSYKSIEFARVYGTKGQRLKFVLDDLEQQYKNSGFSKVMERDKLSAPHRDDLKNMAYAINAFFGRHGTVYGKQQQTTAAWISALTNMRLMGTVSLANLGDILQTFQNSNSFKGWVQGTYSSFRTPKLPFTKTRVYDVENMTPADLLYIHQDNLVKKALQRTGAGAFGPEQGVTPQAMEWARLSNEKFFKLVGLEDVTLFARKYAFNVGAADGLNIARQLANTLRGSGKSFGQLIDENSFRGKRFRDLINTGHKYNLFNVEKGLPTNLTEVLKFGSFKSYKEAMKDKVGVQYMIRAGQTAMNRDAIIPSVGNRMLFTQSKNPWVKLLGQFSSWAQAKSAQTNALLQRIEEGDAKLAFKMLSVIPIYAAVHQLRQYIKHGFRPEDTEGVDPLLDGWALTGNNGWLLNTTSSYLKYNKNRPLGIFPGYETIVAPLDFGFDVMDTKTSLNTDLLQFFDNIAPTPEFRGILATIAPDYAGWMDYKQYMAKNRANKDLETKSIFNVKDFSLTGTGMGIR